MQRARVKDLEAMVEVLMKFGCDVELCDDKNQYYITDINLGKSAYIFDDVRPESLAECLSNKF